MDHLFFLWVTQLLKWVQTLPHTHNRVTCRLWLKMGPTIGGWHCCPRTLGAVGQSPTWRSDRRAPHRGHPCRDSPTTTGWCSQDQASLRRWRSEWVKAANRSQAQSNRLCHPRWLIWASNLQGQWSSRVIPVLQAQAPASGWAQLPALGQALVPGRVQLPALGQALVPRWVQLPALSQALVPGWVQPPAQGLEWALHQTRAIVLLERELCTHAHHKSFILKMTMMVMIIKTLP